MRLLMCLAVIACALPALAQEGDAVFEVEAINEGLAQPPDLDRSTPRAAMEGFIDSVDAENYRQAAHFLNLNDIEAAQQAERGPELAYQLHEILERTILIDWGDLPDRADGVDDFASADDALAGQPRRSLRLGLIDVDGRPTEIRLDRYQASGDDALWLISNRTVGYIPALFEEHGPGRVEQALPNSIKREAIGGVPIWQMIAVPLFIIMATIAGMAAYRLVRLLARTLRSRLGRFGRRRSETNDDLVELPGWRWIPNIMEHTALSVALLIASVVVAAFHAEYLSFSGPTNVLMSAVITVALVVTVAMVFLSVINALLDIVTSNFVAEIANEENSASRALYTNISVARRLVILVAIIFGGIVIVSQLNLSQTVGTSLLASAGVLSLIFGFAAQSVLGNILSSIQIAFAKPIRIGDAVSFRGDWGYVEEINFTFVLIRTWDNRRLIAPVREFVSEPFENWSMRDAALMVPVEIKLDPTADVAAIRAHFEELLREQDDWDGAQEPKVSVIDQNDRAMTVRLYASAKDPSAAWELRCVILEKIFAFIRQQEDGRWLPREREEKAAP